MPLDSWCGSEKVAWSWTVLVIKDYQISKASFLQAAPIF